MSSEEDYGYAESQQGSDDSEAYGYNSGSDGGDSEYGELIRQQFTRPSARKLSFSLDGPLRAH